MPQRTLSSGKASMYQEKLRSISWDLAFGSIALLSYIATIVLSDSLTVLAELMKNVVLLLAVCMSWLALRRVAKGKDPYYNYGYGKVENLQSLVVAALMLAAIGIVIYEVIHRLQHPLHIEGAGLTIGIASAAFSVVAYLLLWRHDHHLAEKEASPVMESL